MPKYTYPIFLTCLMLMSACNVPKDLHEETTATAFDFVDQNSGLTEILHKAKQENKLVFLDVYASWCRPCQIMDEEVFTNEKLAEYFNANFINYKVNAEKGKGFGIANAYDVRAYPTLLFLDADGHVLVKKEGLAFNRELKKLAKESLKISTAE